ncbi:hydantoinase/oxoprolinase family protein [Pusillimonas sp. ANT_WB101]|uniref:hydantoinase/oxoprolinase family protein n=1 Tax=Pusillimonas sp. ANT_WB101 TaxID=2597356 RepID=UPI0011EE41DE|nr:hydantoinase/oxoprolinase family protein [Pusillimonas sp. ANT_WB101]KAA0911344.1 hydantoinase/oxoprolinase family protein [Pusillimonas sp. ANT_WB101]
MAIRIGVDSGGTFTDLCTFDENTGELSVSKIASTPHDPSEGIAEGVRNMLRDVGRRAQEVSFLGHGTTVGTNALIQLKGTKTALVVTEGFRDLLEIGRQKRPSLYDLYADKPVVLVSRDLRFEISERLKFDGSVVTPFDLDGLEEIIETIRGSEAKAVAVCFLYSFINNQHEALIKQRLQDALPGVFISVSNEVAPEFREFERMSTVVVNAYLGPIMKTYIDRLKHRLDDFDLVVEPKLTQSNGGVISFESASKFPVRTVLSGPSTGVVSAQKIAKMIGLEDIITFDMGGTSSDVALLINGTCNLSSHSEVHGYPLKVPMLDIHTVGAGGGSIAFVDEGGLMKVGPESAGAFPGPICYGNGGTSVTVTDANIVLQTLNPERFLDGKMQVQREKSVDAIQVLADQLGIGLMETAHGVIAVATSNMAKAIRVISTQRGYDPREYPMMAFGGAGPLHAARLARELEIKKIVVPLYPGVLCAMGLLLTDLSTNFMATKILGMDDKPLVELQAIFSRLFEDAEQWFVAEDVQLEDRDTELYMDMRYVGQNYELPIKVSKNFADEADLLSAKEAFMQAHHKQYGFSGDDPIQLVTYRLVATGKTKHIPLKQHAVKSGDASQAVRDTRDVWYSEHKDWRKTTIYDRSLLQAGDRFQGPAIVEQMDTTTVILPGMSVEVDCYLNLVIEDIEAHYAS